MLLPSTLLVPMPPEPAMFRFSTLRGMVPLGNAFSYALDELAVLPTCPNPWQSCEQVPPSAYITRSGNPLCAVTNGETDQPSSSLPFNPCIPRNIAGL